MSKYCINFTHLLLLVPGKHVPSTTLVEGEKGKENQDATEEENLHIHRTTTTICLLIVPTTQVLFRDDGCCRSWDGSSGSRCCCCYCCAVTRNSSSTEETSGGQWRFPVNPIASKWAMRPSFMKFSFPQPPTTSLLFPLQSRQPFSANLGVYRRVHREKSTFSAYLLYNTTSRIEWDLSNTS